MAQKHLYRLVKCILKFKLVFLWFQMHLIKRNELNDLTGRTLSCFVTQFLCALNRVVIFPLNQSPGGQENNMLEAKLIGEQYKC